eukprot:CAMPEP_0172514380 /NCGR_PEP_ID=MMETSP1066-20121228/259710_1 /TAXON_ID=671091 /ORGANISM="Coscinodiscus wailesii, Strain CCMP2513" /LENGTH=850 /DNA_ID=CAMNT_0013295025 /DNA_START=29 /DNA_END=2581 /DNA_ORIENTATION=+
MTATTAPVRRDEPAPNDDTDKRLPLSSSPSSLSTRPEISSRANVNRMTNYGRRRTIVVLLSFYASIFSFFVAGCYDYTRPNIISRLLLFSEKINSLLFWNAAVAVTGNGTALQSAVIVTEVLILVPTILFLLPLTKLLWTRYNNNTPSTRRRRRLRQSLPPSSTALTVSKNNTTQKRQALFVSWLLEAISWLLWTIAMLCLMIGVFHFVPHRFGCISFAALLALLAQGVALVAILWDHDFHCNEEEEEEEDDIRREILERSGGGSRIAVEGILADAWVKKNKNLATTAGHGVAVGDDDTSTEKCRKNNHTIPITKGQKEEHNTASTISTKRDDKTALSSAAQKDVASVNFVVFFLMNTGLLQSPYYLQVGIHYSDSGSSIPKEIPGAVLFVVTILVPLFTHGVGGRMFHREEWSFHHAFQGGTHHVTAQATGWSLLSFAALMHLAFLILGMGHQHVYLLHSGSFLAWVAEITLLYSLLNFRPTSSLKKSGSQHQITITSLIALAFAGGEHVFWYLFSFIQDLYITNMHWFYTIWLFATLCGFNAFSFHPFRSFGNFSLWKEVLLNTALVLGVWSLPALLVPYTSRRKEWKRLQRLNPFAIYNTAFERVMFGRKGLFCDSMLRSEEEVGVYQRDGAMFAILPHGTLPTSVFAVFYQFADIFENVCLFFGSQVSLVPGYRFFMGMRGGCQPVERKRLVKVMRTGQNVSLVPGGVHEMLKCTPHQKTYNVSIKHKGFVRLAIQEGYDLVPTFFFHANDQFNNPMLNLQLWTYRATKIPIGVPLYTNKYYIPMSNRNPIRVALGRRICIEKKNAHPSEEEIEALHRMFYEEVARIWNKYKEEFGYGDRELVYVT